MSKVYWIILLLEAHYLHLMFCDCLPTASWTRQNFRVQVEHCGRFVIHRLAPVIPSTFSNTVAVTMPPWVVACSQSGTFVTWRLNQRPVY